MYATSPHSFPGFDHALHALRTSVAERAELRARLGEIGLQRRAPVLVLVGGADGMDAETMIRLEHLFARTIAPIVDALGAYVVDGGTDAGVMGMMGRARAACGAAFPLVGVVPEHALMAPPTSGQPAQIEPHHSHVVLVPGTRWEAAGPWMSWVAEELAGEMPSVTLLINGGDTSWDSARQSVKDGRPVIAVAGSGRAADALAAALVGGEADPRASEVLATGQVETACVADGPATLGRLLGRHLTAAAVPAGERAAPAREGLEALEALIDGLELSAPQKHFLRSRWLDQMRWMSRKARQAQQRYYALRLMMMMGSLAIPVLVGLSLGGLSAGTRLWQVLASITGMLVAVSAILEELFRYGDRWRQYRRTAEQLKAEGRHFLQRTGRYQRFHSHDAAYGELAGAIDRALEEGARPDLDELGREDRTAGNTRIPGAPARSGTAVSGSA